MDESGSLGFSGLGSLAGRRTSSIPWSDPRSVQSGAPGSVVDNGFLSDVGGYEPNYPAPGPREYRQYRVKKIPPPDLGDRQKLIPETGDEYSRYIEHGSSRIRGTDELKSRDPVQNKYEQITPIDPNSSSNNWATEAPRKGFDMSDLSTYQIRDSDRLQSELFDRFVLKDKANLYGGADQSLGKLITARLGPPVTSFEDIRAYARGAIRGSSHVSVRSMEEDRINY